MFMKNSEEGDRTKKIILWILSFFVTLLVAYYQRISGPTYPLKEKHRIASNVFYSHFPRSCTRGKECEISVQVSFPGGKSEKIFLKNINGKIKLKRHKSYDKWKYLDLAKEGARLRYILPEQPSGGKLEYQVFVYNENRLLFETPLVIVRFKNEVPPLILSLHIFFVFLFLFFTSRIFFGFFERGYIFKHTVLLNILFLILGGFVFGPMTQKYAFGAYWTGFPCGKDLTDTKALVMLVFWMVAAYFVLRNKKSQKYWLFLAFLVTFVAYFIPHSLFGTEINYLE